MNRQFRWRNWHRRIGVFCSAIIILLSISGLFLNHSDHWDFLKQPLPSVLAQWLYSAKIANEPTAETCPNQITIETLSLIKSKQWIRICSSSLELLNADRELIERFDESSGLPKTLKAYGWCGDYFCVQGTTNNYYRLVNYFWQPIEVGDQIDIDHLTPLTNINYATGLHWQRLLLDLHAGRFFGQVRVWLMDIVALAILFLACSGCYLWYRK